MLKWTLESGWIKKYELVERLMECVEKSAEFCEALREDPELDELVRHAIMEYVYVGNTPRKDMDRATRLLRQKLFEEMRYGLEEVDLDELYPDYEVPTFSVRIPSWGGDLTVADLKLYIRNE